MVNESGWRMRTDKNGLWKEILELKYGSSTTLNNLIKNKHESWWWRDLRKVCDKGQNGTSLLISLGAKEGKIRFDYGKIVG